MPPAPASPPAARPVSERSAARTAARTAHHDGPLAVPSLGPPPAALAGSRHTPLYEAVLAVVLEGLGPAGHSRPTCRGPNRSAAALARSRRPARRSLLRRPRPVCPAHRLRLGRGP